MSETDKARVVYLTAGAAGMYCGSCMHDNTLVRALAAGGWDIQLVPTYTPIRTDEVDVSTSRVFFGGINVFLQQKVPLLRVLPAGIDGVLNNSWLVRRATSRPIEVNPKLLGELTVSMLKGQHGHQRKEGRRLAKWLAAEVRPDLIVFTNLLIGGCIDAIRDAVPARILVALQGDDVFLDSLQPPYRQQAISLMRRLVRDVDGFLVHTRFYGDYMSQYFDIPADKISVTPLGLDVSDFAVFLDRQRGVTGGEPPRQPGRAPDAGPGLTFSTGQPPTIGYLARLAPEKGLHLLVDSFLRLKQHPQMQQARLEIAGWLGPDHQRYARQQFDRLDQAGHRDCWRYWGSVSREEKLRFLAAIDVLSVPAPYREPKGIYVLEALAAAVPVVQPNHGAFPEILADTGGGLLVTPEDTSELAEALTRLLTDAQCRRELGAEGQRAVHQRRHAQQMAVDTAEVFRQHLQSAKARRSPVAAQDCGGTAGG